MAEVRKGNLWGGALLEESHTGSWKGDTELNLMNVGRETDTARGIQGSVERLVRLRLRS